MSQDARSLLRFSTLAYKSHSDLPLMLSGIGCTLIDYVNDLATGTQGFACVSVDGDVIVAFRGTEVTSIKDVKTDLRYSLTLDAETGGRCHRGFLEAANSIVSVLIHDLKHFDSRNVYVTGHSLGAALATLIALRLHTAGFSVQEVHTFGSPRVGDSAFAKAYEDKLGEVTVRHQYCCDAVTRLPSYFQGFRHVGQLQYYDEHGFNMGPASLAYRVLDGLCARFDNLGSIPTAGVKHHRLSSYDHALN